MLARAARPQLRRDALRSQSQSQSSATERLALPWLCPAQMRWAARTARMGSTTPPRPLESRKPHRRATSALSSRHETRSLATAADSSLSAPSAPPFHDLVQAWARRKPDPELSRLHPWDTSRPLVVHDAMSSLAVPVSPVRWGVGGDPIELHQNLYACLRVGRMDRASAIIHRLSGVYSQSAPELVDAHNVFLQAMFEQSEGSPSKKAMTNIEEWYVENMVHKGIEPNAQTLVTLIRAAMNFLEEDKQEDAVRKYLSLAEERGSAVLDDVNGSPDFSDEEWDTLIRLQSHTLREPPSVDSVQEIQISTPAGQALAVQHGLIPDPTLLIKPVQQKGMGLSSLKQALSQFEPGEGVPYPHETEGSREEKDRAYAYMRQVRMEEDSLRAATERWKAEDKKLEEMGIHGVLQSKSIQALMWKWYSALVPKLEAEIKRTKEVLSKPSVDNQSDDRHIYGPYIEALSPETLAGLSVSSLLHLAAGTSRDDVLSLKLSGVSLSLGREAEDRSKETARVRHDAFLRKTRKIARRDLLTKLNKGKKVAVSEIPPPPAMNISSNTQAQEDWPMQAKVKVGALLLENLIQSAMITVTREDPKTGKQLTSTQPAFHHNFAFANGKKVGFLVPHQEVRAKLRNESVAFVQTIKLPMLVEPKPWTAFNEGGYYTLRDQAVRTKANDSQRAYAISAIENGDMKKVLAGLDTLGKVPWRINRDVFSVMAESWNRGEGIGGLVPEDPKLHRPTEPDAGAPFEARMKFLKDLKAYENEKGGLHSERCYQNFQLEIARAFQNEKLYYPHSVDFRGRAYPVPPVLNHIGADVSRGLLRFANGKELGEVGLQWLKIQLANLYGYDKASLKNREQFAMDNLAEVYDSANNPLDGNRWWTKADDPWQCLACCIELKNALDSPEPTRFISQLPVHQDGTCNGLQHYAALGGDEAGANQVNLEPSDKPQDIYTGVAEMVKEMVADDAKKGNAIALFLDGKITRSVVKRTVMTNVYGVTFVGAKDQVLDELRKIFPNYQSQEGIPDLFKPAMYVARKIFLALGKIFNGAQEIQYWLGECGDRITTSLSADQIRKIHDRYEGHQVLGYDTKYNQKKKVTERLRKAVEKNNEAFKTSIIWTTPLKMPVVQPYRKKANQVVKTSIATISISKQQESDVVDKRKQLQAFPPNFIHSLDATHMTLSALKCSELGLDFAAVHDSFWTHAADIPTLNVVLRDAFVRMHSEDIIGRLAAEFKARYAGAMYCANLKYSSAAAAEILQWRRKHFKNLAKVHKAAMPEVALEVERQDLLKSDDPEQRKKGEAMVTPTSIWLKYRDPLSLASSRLSLLGQTQSRAKADVLKEKILGAEAEALEEAASSDAEPVPVEEDNVVEEATEELVDEQADEVNDKDEGDVAQTKRPSNTSNVKVWLPLTFPPIPKKGQWDIKRLRESQYFFS